jgi:hypothetical protein
MVELPGTVHPQTHHATDMGAVDSSLPLDFLTLNIAPSAAQEQEIAALQAALQNPKSPQYHRWLNQSEYGALFGLTDADLGQVTSWLESQGFTVKNVSASRNAISFSGKVWQVESAFRTQLHQYKLGGETHFANATALSLPAQFLGVVLNVSGLDDFRPKPNVRRQAVTPDFTVSSSAHYLSPADWATIYDVNTIYNAGFDGTGIHVGIVGQTYAPQADIANFRTATGMSAAQLTYYCISTANCTDTAGITSGDLAEADLDIEWAGGIAKNATVDYIYASGADQSQGVFSALQYAIQEYKTTDGTVLPIISMSYDSCEMQSPATLFTLVGTLGLQASLQGQTLVVASGDSGAAGCDPHSDTSNLTAELGLSVEVPADSPNFTAVGGTTLSGDESAPATFWNQTPNLLDSALSYIPETTWNETGSTGLAASGGGESAIPTGGTKPAFPQPTWQSGLIAGTTGRLVPDIAFAAASAHDGYLNCSSDFNSTTYGTMCAKGGFYSSGGTGGSVFYLDGGTSASTPSFAGMLGLLVQRYGPLGNINPTLYSLAANPTTYAAVFRDITTGNSNVPCLAGTNGCLGGTLGYSATTGYDMATGLGSIDGGALYTALASLATRATTTTTLASSSRTVSLGSTTTLTATVVSATAGTISGTVTFMVGSTILGTASVSGGIAGLNMAVSSVNGWSAGTDSITAGYSGDTSFASSTGTATLTVTGTQPTTTTVTATPNSVALGSTTTLTATVNPSTATGVVTFKVGNTILSTATPVLNGTSTLNGIAATSANGFTTGANTITATYSGDTGDASSTGIANATVSLPGFTLATNGSSISTTAGGGGSVTLNLTSTGYAGTVSFTTAISCSNGSPSNISASVPPVTLTAGGNATSTLTITANTIAAKETPRQPWRSGVAVVLCAVVLSVPFKARRKRELAVLLMAGIILSVAFLIACGGSSGGSSGGAGGAGSAGSPVKAARIYTVTVTPTATPAVTSLVPSAVSVTVTVQ